MSVVFVSSTFKDMHYERDAIRDIVAPEVNEVAREYGQYVSFVDLRWGIDTQGMGDNEDLRKEQKVLDVCLDEIDRSNPPIIVILGDRYGWMPGVDGQRVRDPEEKEASLIGRAIDRKKDFSLDDELISVTALEVEYGALRNSDLMEKALVYYRTIEGDCEERVYSNEGRIYAEKRELLRKHIEGAHGEGSNGACGAVLGCQPKCYTVHFDDGRMRDGDIAAFAKMVAEDVLAEMEPGWKEIADKTPLQRSLKLHRDFMEEKAKYLIAREAERDRYATALSGGNGTHLVLKGEPGSGKTTLLASIASKLEGEGANVLFISCGYTPESSDSAGVLRLVVEWLSSALLDEDLEGVDRKGLDDLIVSMEDLCEKCALKNIRPIILVDAVDQLSPDENRERLVFLPRSAKVEYIVTCVPDFNVGDRECGYLASMSDRDERLAVIKSLEETGARKEMGEPVREYLLGLPASESPLFLSMAMQTLMMLDRQDYAEINERERVEGAKGGKAPDEVICEYLASILERCPKSLAGMSAKLIAEAIAHTGTEQEPMLRAVSYLAVSRRGLRSEDIQAIHENRFSATGGNRFDVVGFALVRSYFRSCFMQRADTRFDFMHKSIREGFLASISADELPGFHADILEALCDLDEDDPVRIEEEAYHAFGARDSGRIFKCMHDCQNLVKNRGRGGARAAEEKAKRLEDIAVHRSWVLANDVRECCEADEDRWFAGQIVELTDLALGEGVVDFVNEWVYPFAVVGRLSVSELLVAKSTLESTRDLATAMREKCDTLASRERLALTSYNLAYVLGTIGGVETERSIKFYYDAYELRNKNRHGALELYARSCDNLASNLQGAVDKRVDIDTSFFQSDEGGESQTVGEIVIGLFEEEIEIRSKLLKEIEGSPDSSLRDLQGARENLAWAYSNMASKGIGYGPFEDVDVDADYRVDDLYEESLALREAVLRAGGRGSGGGSPADKEKVAYSEVLLARHLLKRFPGDGCDANLLKRACDLAEDACHKREDVNDEANDSKSVKDLAESYAVYAKALAAHGEFTRAMERYDMALGRIRKAVAMLGTFECKYKLIEYLGSMAETLILWAKQGNPANPAPEASGLRCCMALSEATGWLEGMNIDHPQDKKSREMLLGYYDRLIGACELFAPDLAAGYKARKAALGM